MKHINSKMVRRTCGAWILLAVAPLAGAQTPSAAAIVPAPSSSTGQAPAGPAAGAAAATPGSPATAETAPAQSIDQTSYLFGLTLGEQLHRVGIAGELSVDAVVRGVREGMQGKKSTPADQQTLQEFVHTAMEAALARNQATAKDFLARNASEKGVISTASGLEYKVLAAGDRKAAAITPADEVTVQYRGKLLDGTEFDSSYSRGMPATFVVSRVIKGWTEALVLMKPGAKWELFVPPDLAYGNMPKPGIPPGSLLIFDVELVSVKASAAPAAAPVAKPLPKSK
jgi:FKBP-type peptidyl-prolyl cis-trans isomerase